MTDANQILIIGASCRAAAWSARQAGYSPITIDFFRDSDTVKIAQHAFRASSFAEAIQIAETVPKMPWFYTGGLEHSPELIDQLAKQLPLLGCRGDVVRQVRNPILMFEMFREAGFIFAESRPRFLSPMSPSEWLRKPYQSCGGRDITFASQDDIELQDHRYFFQRYYHSQSYSATYSSHDHRCHLLGVCRQLIGPVPELGSQAPPFRFAGNIGPLRLPCESALKAIGHWLTQEIGMRGVWGLDFGLQDDIPVIYEINPRYTASVEIHERTYRSSFFHSEQFSNQDPMNHSWGKIVVYATRDFVFQQTDLLSTPDVLFADIPHDYEQCRANQPVMTILAKCVKDNLLNVIRDTHQLLGLRLPIS